MYDGNTNRAGGAGSIFGARAIAILVAAGWLAATAGSARAGFFGVFCDVRGFNLRDAQVQVQQTGGLPDEKSESVEAALNQFVKTANEVVPLDDATSNQLGIDQDGDLVTNGPVELSVANDLGSSSTSVESFSVADPTGGASLGSHVKGDVSGTANGDDFSGSWTTLGINQFRITSTDGGPVDGPVELQLATYIDATMMGDAELEFMTGLYEIEGNTETETVTDVNQLFKLQKKVKLFDTNNPNFGYTLDDQDSIFDTPGRVIDAIGADNVSDIDSEDAALQNAAQFLDGLDDLGFDIGDGEFGVLIVAAIAFDPNFQAAYNFVSFLEGIVEDASGDGASIDAGNSLITTVSVNTPGVELQVAPVPEPGTLALMAGGLFCVGLRTARRRRR